MVLGNFQCRDVLVGKGRTVLAVCADGSCLDNYFLATSFLSHPLRQTAQYRLKYCLKRPLNTFVPHSPDTQYLTRESP